MGGVVVGRVEGVGWIGVVCGWVGGGEVGFNR